MAETSTGPSTHRAEHRQHPSQRENEAEQRSYADLPAMLTPAPTLAGQVIGKETEHQKRDANGDRKYGHRAARVAGAQQLRMASSLTSNGSHVLLQATLVQGEAVRG